MRKRRDDIAVADMVADMAADMEVDKVADMFADKVAKKGTQFGKKKKGTQFGERVGHGGMVNWAQTFSTRSLPGLRIF